jgi:hypothetical protein
MVGTCVLTLLAILCLLIGQLRPFTFGVDIERCLLFPVISIPLLVSFTYSLCAGWSACSKGLFFLESPYLSLISSSIFTSPLSIFCSAGLIVMNSFSFSLLWKVLISSLTRKDSFAG